MRTAKHFLQCDSAATATEYAILLAAIGGLLLASLTAFGNESGTFLGPHGRHAAGHHTLINTGKNKTLPTASTSNSCW